MCVVFGKEQVVLIKMLRTEKTSREPWAVFGRVGLRVSRRLGDSSAGKLWLHQQCEVNLQNPY